MLPWIYKIVGHPNERKIKQLMPTVDHINDLEAEFAKLSDEALAQKTVQFRQEIDNRERSSDLKRDRQLEQDVLDLLLPEAFAVVREAGKRVLGMRHFDVQMLGGMVLHKGAIAEMRTGEGKTLVATLPVYLNALTGKGVHVVTVNDYLAKRDAEWMGQLYRFLGLSVGTVLSQQRGNNSFAEKKAAYAADITYGTNNEFGFDYLRDNMATTLEQLVQRPYQYAVIDEVDSILIDEARTPLIISGRLEQSAETYQTMARLAPMLQPERDYTVDEKARNIILNEEGIDRAQELLNTSDLFDPKNNLAHYLLNALKAKELFRRDIEYVVKEGHVVIVDEFTGRLMDGRRWSDGLHQAVEAKESVNIQDETQTLASITFQNLFRLYPKLAGMTGTAMTEEAEFGKIYNLEVTTIPTNRSDVRTDNPDVIYKTEPVKYFKAVEDIIEHHVQGRPVLVGTVSIEKSEYLSSLLTTPNGMNRHLRDKCKRLIELLEGQKSADIQTLLPKLKLMLDTPESHQAEDFEKFVEDHEALGDYGDFVSSIGTTVAAVHAIRKGIPHHVLNAKQHEQEAFIVAQAGRYGAVTIATNMAGRGTDILLGGNPEFLAKQELLEQGRNWLEVDDTELKALIAAKKVLTDEEKEKVVAAGGLHIIGTERHESRRIDNQLRGRAARQGDPGSTKFYLSLEDSLMRLFGGSKIAGLMDMMGVDETLPITSGLVNKAIEGAQRKVEAYHFDIRKNILQYDDVLTEQRALIYSQRRQVLEGQNLRASIRHMIEQTMTRLVSTHLAEDGRPDDWDQDALTTLLATLHVTVPQLAAITLDDLKGKSYKDLVSLFHQWALKVYEQLETEMAHVSQTLKEQHGITLEGLEALNPAQLQSTGTIDELDAELTAAAQQAQDDEAHRNNPLRRIEREILLSIIDSKWIDYLHNLDSLREGIGLRAYGQKDPLIEYKREAFEMFQHLTYDIQTETVQLLFRARIEIQLDGVMPDSLLQSLSQSAEAEQATVAVSDQEAMA
jgi:preprotein translocase subunit SecA